MRRLDRYLLSEILGPLGLGLASLYIHSAGPALLQPRRDDHSARRARGDRRSAPALLAARTSSSSRCRWRSSSACCSASGGWPPTASWSRCAPPASASSAWCGPVVLLSTVAGGRSTWSLMLWVAAGGQPGLLAAADRDRDADHRASKFEPRVFYPEFQGKTLWRLRRASRTALGAACSSRIRSRARRSSVFVRAQRTLEVDDEGEQVVLRLDRRRASTATISAVRIAYEIRKHAEAPAAGARPLRERGAQRGWRARRACAPSTFGEYQAIARDPDRGARAAQLGARRDAQALLDSRRLPGARPSGGAARLHQPSGREVVGLRALDRNRRRSTTS